MCSGCLIRGLQNEIQTHRLSRLDMSSSHADFVHSLAFLDHRPKCLVGHAFHLEAEVGVQAALSAASSSGRCLAGLRYDASVK